MEEILWFAALFGVAGLVVGAAWLAVVSKKVNRNKVRNAGVIAIISCGILVVASLLAGVLFPFGRLGSYAETDTLISGGNFLASTDSALAEPSSSDSVHSHSYFLDVTVAPGCNRDGHSVYVCDCGDRYVSDKTDAVGHVWSDWIITKEATSGEEGSRERVCSNCSEKECEALPALPAQHIHDYSVRLVEATCSEQGYSVYTCSCGHSYEDNFTNILQHSYFSAVVAPTCTTRGYTHYACSLCGHQYEDIYVDPTGHDYGDWGEVRAPSCTQKGREERKCERCGKKDVRSSDKLGHDFQCVETKESTATVAGYKVYRCAECNVTCREELPLLQSAKDTDMCGESLLGKVLPNAKYRDFAEGAMPLFHSGYSYDEAYKFKFQVDTAQSRSILFEFEETYRYICCALPYSFANVGQDRYFFGWCPEDAYQRLLDCYAEVFRILDELGIDSSVTQREAIYRINDYLCEFKHYNYGEDRCGDIDYSLFSAKGVCHNYSIAFQMLCLGAGIECHYYSSKTMSHAWNKVYFSDGTYYWVDVCWNDGQSRLGNGTVVETSVENGVSPERVAKMRSRYLLVTTEELCKDHSL